jgi:hypothetical protein
MKSYGFYIGDIRATREMESYDLLRGIHIDELFLDSTFAFLDSSESVTRNDCEMFLLQVYGSSLLLPSTT